LCHPILFDNRAKRQCLTTVHVDPIQEDINSTAVHLAELCQELRIVSLILIRHH